MTPRSKLLTLVLLSAIMNMPLSGLMPQRSAASPPAECHRHQPKPPARMPVSYQCCATGHWQALLQAPVVLHPALLHVLHALAPEPVLLLASFHNLPAPPASGEPPGIAVLRI